MATRQLTGYPSIDKPWLKYYSGISQEKTYSRIYDCIKAVWRNENDIIINYYGHDITVQAFFSAVHDTAKALQSFGVVKGMSIALSLESVPEFVEILLAAELIGCSLKNYIGNVDEIIEVINSCTADIYIAHDYISENDTQKIYQDTDVKSIIMVSPYISSAKGLMRPNIVNAINEKYTIKKSEDKRNIDWSNFIRIGQEKDKVFECKTNNILFSAFTSGTSGKPKEVIHTSESILGIISQLALFPFPEKERDTWLLTILPPTLVAVVVAMICYPLADGKTLILDPFCKMEDLDLEIIHYRPNCWGLAPVFSDVLIESDRIPQDYDMSYFKLFGFGAEPMTKKRITKVQHFLDNHNCKASFSQGYGQSEGGSDFTVAIGRDLMASGSAGIPLIGTVVSIFKPNTTIELKYGQIGEICKAGPGLMLGYADRNETEKVLKKHSDGLVWLHTGDYGFMTEEGMLFVVGRDGIRRYPDKMVFPLSLENVFSDLDGVKDAVIVAGEDEEHEGYESIYLFIIPEKNSDREELLERIHLYICEQLPSEEKPTEIYFIDKKPISHFKTDRKLLKKIFEL